MEHLHRACTSETMVINKINKMKLSNNIHVTVRLFVPDDCQDTDPASLEIVVPLGVAGDQRGD